MYIENIFKEFTDTKVSLNQQIEKLNEQLANEKNNSIAKVVMFYRENPDSQLHDGILEHFGRNGVCIVLKEIIANRSLSLEEITPTLVHAITATEWHHNNPHSSEKPELPMTLAEDVFNALDTDEKKVKLTLFGNSTCDISSLSKSAKKFVKERFDLDSEYGGHGDKSSVIYISGYNHEASTLSFSVSFSKESYKDIESVVESMLKLYTANSQLCYFSIFEKDLCANGSYAICIESTDSGEKAYLSGSYKDDTYFDGSDLREQLINACKYAADRYWYFNQEA